MLTLLFVLFAPSARAELPTDSLSTSETVTERRSTAHLQATLVPQRHEAMPSPYQSDGSFIGTPEQNMSFSSTVFLGYRPFKYTEFYFNPEVIGGGGLSNAVGMGAYPNGEINRVGHSGFQVNLARVYFSQSIPLTGELEGVADDQNQISGYKASKYLRVSAGKYSLADFLDSNSFGHDQRTQFLNWCLMDNCAWDYSMDQMGYTYAVTVELNLKSWALRAALATEPTEVNGATMDWSLARSHNLNLELEKSYALRGHLGKVRLLAYENSTLSPLYADAAAAIANSGAAADAGESHSKVGYGINVEQELSEDVGVFARAGYNDGRTESWTFTEADTTLAGGVALSGRLWRRANDTAGLGLGVNGISPDHRSYLDNGGKGLMLGDSALSYAPEQFAEAYYSFEVPGVRHLAITPDFQVVANPGFNQDRGPAAVYAMRLHYDWGM